MYRPRQVPQNASADWWMQELQNLATAFNAAVDGVILKKLYAQPSRLYEGLTVLADGTTWNPGAGAGVYTYYGGAWNKLG